MRKFFLFQLWKNPAVKDMTLQMIPMKRYVYIGKFYVH